MGPSPRSSEDTVTRPVETAVSRRTEDRGEVGATLSMAVVFLLPVAGLVIEAAVTGKGTLLRTLGVAAFGLAWFVACYVGWRGQQDGVAGVRGALGAMVLLVRGAETFRPARPALPAGESACCQFCGTALEDLPVLVCPDCRTPHHRDCWDENQGCTTYGCDGVADVPERTEVRRLRAVLRDLAWGAARLTALLLGGWGLLGLGAYLELTGEGLLCLLVGFGALWAVAGPLLLGPRPTVRSRRFSAVVLRELRDALEPDAFPELDGDRPGSEGRRAERRRPRPGRRRSRRKPRR